jgi:ATP-dependent DNA ligase
MWLHEIKHDGFRVIARNDGACVRLYSPPVTIWSAPGLRRHLRAPGGL